MLVESLTDVFPEEEAERSAQEIVKIWQAENPDSDRYVFVLSEWRHSLSHTNGLNLEYPRSQPTTAMFLHRSLSRTPSLKS